MLTHNHNICVSNWPSLGFNSAPRRLTIEFRDRALGSEPAKLRRLSVGSRLVGPLR